MSEASKAARSAMKKKIANMVAGDPRQKVDASSWTPPEMMNTEAKTGLRPISRRAFKKGGKVVACMGEDAKQNAGKKPRKAGGGEASKYANAKVNRNVKEANAELGKPHIGGYKEGGDVSQDKKLIKKAFRQHETAEHGGKHVPLKLRKGGKICKMDGGDVIMTEPKPAKLPTQAEIDAYNAMMAAKAEAEAAREAARKAREGKKSGGRAKHKAGGGDVSGIMKRLQILEDARRDVDMDPTSEKGEMLFGGAREAALRNKRKDAAMKAEEMRIASRRGPSADQLRAAAPERYKAFRSKNPVEPEELSLRDKMVNKFQGVDDDSYAKGGKIKPNYEGGTRPTGGRLAKAYGGGLMGELAGAKSKSKGKKSKGKTDITINISTAPKPDAMMPPKPPMMPPPGPPMLPPGPPPGAPPGMMPPPGGPMGMPPGGPPMPPPGMMGRKAGGRVGHRTYRSYKDMDAGSGGGLGRLEKSEIQEHKAGRKEGGRVGHRKYRSYKDMDAGSGGGLGRLEKTEIQEHKRK
tara:strand:- start:1054 stop:2613 length:1560 start_codon:yes stop_codon:yes gene_type:complete